MLENVSVSAKENSRRFAPIPKSTARVRRNTQYSVYTKLYTKGSSIVKSTGYVSNTKKSENCAEIVPTFLLRFEAKKPEFCTGSYLASLLTMNSEFSLQMESPVSQSNLQHDSQVHLRG